MEVSWAVVGARAPEGPDLQVREGHVELWVSQMHVGPRVPWQGRG